MPTCQPIRVEILDADEKFLKALPGGFQKLQIDYLCQFSAEEIAHSYAYKVDISLYAPLEGHGYDARKLFANCTQWVPASNVVAAAREVVRSYSIHVLVNRHQTLPQGLTSQICPCVRIADFHSIRFVPVVRLSCAVPQLVALAPPMIAGCSGWSSRSCGMGDGRRPRTEKTLRVTESAVSQFDEGQYGDVNQARQ